jgi:hypothetical protein
MAQYQRIDRGAGDAMALASIDDPLVEVEIDEAGEDEGPMFEVIDGKVVEIEPGGIAGIEEKEVGWNDNLAEEIDDQELAILSNQLIREFEVDLDARSEWFSTYQKGLDLIGLKVEERSLPWKDACGVFHPLIAEALIRYVSEAAIELFPPQGPAQYRAIGECDPATMKRGKRVKDELNYQLTVKMPENRDELELTLWRQALAGSCFRKVYKDPILRRTVMKMVPADQLVMAYGCSNLQTSYRYTHIMANTSKNDIRKLINLGFYRDIEISDVVSSSSETQEKIDDIQGESKPFELDETNDLLEMYVDVDLPGFEHEDEKGKATGIKLPYIVTIDKESEKILSIYRNFDEDNKFTKRRTYFSHYKFAPGFGPYGTGLIHLLGGVSDAATSILRQLVDAGTMNNVPSGFKSRNLRIKGDDGPLRPGELRDIDLPPGMLSKSIEWVPTKEPSAVLAQLLGVLVEEGRRVGSLSDMKIGDAGGAGAPVGTTLALIERHTRVISAVGVRNYISMDSELRMAKDIIANEMDDQYEYVTEGGEKQSRKEDFQAMNIVPTADPSGSTMSQRIMRLTAAETLASKQPQYYDMPFLHRMLVETMELPNAEKIVPLPDEFVPIDPVSENMNILMMRPVKAHLIQDHEAHIAVHMAAMQDPKMQQIIGQNPNAAAIQAAAMAHISEHVAMAYRANIEKEAGITLPAPGQPLDPGAEAALARVSAAAADRVLQRNTAEAKAAINQQAQQDPMVMLRQQELKIKEMDSQIKLYGIQIKSADDAKKLEILAQKEMLEGRIAEATLALQAVELLMKDKQASASAEDQKRNSEIGQRSEVAKQTLQALGLALDTLHANEDRDERRESSKATARANGGTARATRKKPTNKS